MDNPNVQEEYIKNYKCICQIKKFSGTRNDEMMHFSSIWSKLEGI